MAKNSRNSRGLGGNTKLLDQKQPSSAIKWCFTHNFEIIENTEKEQATINKLVVLFKTISKYSIFSLEAGAINARRHLQGYIEFTQPKRLTALKNIIDNTTHWEKSKGSRDDNIIYISKSPLKGPFEFDKKNGPKYTAEELDLITEDMLFDWQREIIDIISKKPEKRKIYWFYSKMGGVGKTEFTKYLIYHYGAKFCQGKKADIMCNILGKDGTNDIKKLYVFNYSRTVEDFVSYDALECVKDGLLFSSKYESNDALIPIPHILVFSNFEPDYEAMSADRWVVKCLDKIDDNKKVDDIGDIVEKEWEEPKKVKKGHKKDYSPDNNYISDFTVGF